MKPAYHYDKDENLFVGPGDRHFNTPPEIVDEFNELHADIEARRVSFVRICDQNREMEAVLRRIAGSDVRGNTPWEVAVARNAVAVIDQRNRNAEAGGV